MSRINDPYAQTRYELHKWGRWVGSISEFQKLNYGSSIHDDSLAPAFSDVRDDQMIHIHNAVYALANKDIMGHEVIIDFYRYRKSINEMRVKHKCRKSKVSMKIESSVAWIDRYLL